MPLYAGLAQARLFALSLSLSFSPLALSKCYRVWLIYCLFSAFDSLLYVVPWDPIVCALCY